jgi:hypothetical protein
MITHQTHKILFFFAHSCIWGKIELQTCCNDHFAGVQTAACGQNHTQINLQSQLVGHLVQWQTTCPPILEWYTLFVWNYKNWGYEVKIPIYLISSKQQLTGDILNRKYSTMDTTSTTIDKISIFVEEHICKKSRKIVRELATVDRKIWFLAQFAIAKIPLVVSKCKKKKFQALKNLAYFYSFGQTNY